VGCSEIKIIWLENVAKWNSVASGLQRDLSRQLLTGVLPQDMETINVNYQAPLETINVKLAASHYTKGYTKCSKQTKPVCVTDFTGAS